MPEQPKKFKPSKALLDEFRITARSLRGKTRELNAFVWLWLEAVASGDEDIAACAWNIVKHSWQELNRSSLARAAKLDEPEDEQEGAAESDDPMDKLNSIFTKAGGGPQ